MGTPVGRFEHTGAAPVTGLSGSITAGATSFSVNSGTGFPTGAVGKFVIAIDPGTASEEKILCSSRATNTFTVAASGRGYDGTTATSHNAGTTNVVEVVSAAEVDDFSDHVNTTTRDDHTQYARVDGTRAFTGGITGTAAAFSGNATVGGTLGVTGAATLSSTLGVTGAATLSSTLGVTGAITGSSTVTGTAHAATLTGTNGRYVGATNGAPSSGTFNTNDFANDPTNGCFWECTAGGSPGTWEQVGGKTDTAWTTVSSFTNSWTGNARFCKISGLVTLQGVVQAGTAGASAFTLPAAYSPSQALYFPLVNSGNSNVSGVVGNVQVTSAGLVVPSISISTQLAFVFSTL